MIEPVTLTRGVIFAALFAPPRQITRNESIDLYSKLSAQVFPEVKHQFIPGTSEIPARTELIENQGRRTNHVLIDIQNNMLRLLVELVSPDSYDMAKRNVDETMEAFKAIVGNSVRMELAEARLIVQVPTMRASPALEVFKHGLFQERMERTAVLGSISHLGFSYTITPDAEATDPLDCPMRQVKIEPLVEDNKFMYLEVMSNWGRQFIRISPDDPTRQELSEGPLCRGVQVPSSYIDNVKIYIEENICKWLQTML